MAPGLEIQAMHEVGGDDNATNFASEAEQKMEWVRQHLHTNKLYGRASHLKQLMDASLRASTASYPEVAIVVGRSGTGKSYLVQTAMEQLVEKGFQFISGKFDQLQHAEPLSAIITAFNRFFDDISRSSAEHIQLTRADILDATGDCSGVLTEFFPSLNKILGEQSTTPAPVGAKEAQHRFEYVFRLMVRAIATPSNPIIFFLDDLHWADTYSLHLITTLVTDREIENFLFLGCFRDDEVDNTHPLSAKLREIEMESVDITKITVANLERKNVNALVSDTFQMSEHLTASLADIVYQKTNGNIFCVIQFLQSLYDGGLLQWSSVSNNWELNMGAIEAEHVPDDAVRIMSGKILQLPEKAQYALKLMSCIGSSCFEPTLELFLTEQMETSLQGKDLVINADKSCQSNNVSSYLGVAVHEGLLSNEGSTYSFEHDQIQCAAYSLIPEDKKGLWHLQIGYAIWNSVSDEDKDEVVFLAADQMNCGISTVEYEEQKVFFFFFNLRAGERAISLSTFSSSASYFGTGIKLLSQEHWEKNYDLCLHLHNYCAEAEYCNGSFSEVGQITGVILTKARSYYDKLRAYLILIKALGAQNRFQEAIDIGVSVLEQLGKQLPSHLSDTSAIYKNFNNVKGVIEGMTRDEFLNMKTMEDSDTLIAMKFMSELLIFTYFAKQEVGICFFSHMMQLSLEYGLCKETCFALASFSTQLYTVGDRKGSELFGHFALSLLDRFDAKEMLPQVYLCVYGGIFIFLEPLKKLSENFLHAYKVGMQTGDIQFAMFSARLYCESSFCHGAELKELERNIQVFGKQMIEYKQESNWNVTIPLKHAVLALINDSHDVSQQSSTFSAETKKSLDEHIEKNRTYPASMCCFYLSCVAYILCDFNFAKDMTEMRWELGKKLCRQFVAFGSAVFFDGLLSIELARESKHEKWTIHAFECLEKTKKSAFNVRHRVLLLETEIDAVVMGKTDDVISKYDMAIDAAGEIGYIHEQAIANERAGDFCLSRRDARASHYYGEAYRLYLLWGATGKAAHLKRKISSV